MILYRIYYQTEVWNLYAISEDENTAWDYWNDCSDLYPHAAVRITQEIIMTEKKGGPR